MLYLSISTFSSTTQNILAFALSPRITSYNWPTIKSTDDRVYSHICRDFNYSDRRLLLICLKLWTADIDKYLSALVYKFRAFRATVHLQPTCKLSIASLRRLFNDVVCKNQLFIANHHIAHLIGVLTQLSAGTIADEISLTSAVCLLPSC